MRLSIKLISIVIFSSLLFVASIFLLSSWEKINSSSIQEAKRIVEVCRDVKGDQLKHEKCTAKEFAEMGEKRGFPFIGELLDSYQSLGLGYQSYQNCHVLAHRIMNDLGSRQAGNWKELMSKLGSEELDPTRCGGGFMHGILEVRAAEDPSFKVNASLYRELCEETVALQSSTSCAHILGHLALVEAYGGLEDALKSCDGLSGEFLFQCYGGIFMEDSMRTNLNVHGLAELPVRNQKWFETQFARCERYRDKFEIANGCWYDLPEVFAQTQAYDLVKIYEFCATAPSITAKDHCYIRASYLVALVPDNLFKSFYTQKLCSAYDKDLNKLSRCMQNVVGAPLSASLQLLDRTVAFCSERPQEAQGQCYNMISKHIMSSNNSFDQKRRFCAQLPEVFEANCLKQL